MDCVTGWMTHSRCDFTSWIVVGWACSCGLRMVPEEEGEGWIFCFWWWSFVVVFVEGGLGWSSVSVVSVSWDLGHKDGIIGSVAFLFSSDVGLYGKTCESQESLLFS